MIADDAVPRCPTCGGDPETCGDPKRVWYPHRTVCLRDREQKMTERVYKALYEKHEWHDGTGTKWADKFSRDTPYHFEDGVSISVTATDQSPGATFLTERTA